MAPKEYLSPRDVNHVVVATTLTGFAALEQDASEAWLYSAEALVRSAAMQGVRVTFFAALEIDARGTEPFEPLLSRLDRLETQLKEYSVRCETWTFFLGDGRTEVDMSNRLRHITVGQNLATDYALSNGADAMLFMAADTAPHPDTVYEFVKLNHPLIGGQVDTYGLDGPVCSRYIPEYRDQIREHMPTAAYVWIRRDLLRFVRWRWDLDAGMSDDPCLYHDALTLFEVQAIVHHGLRGRHYPEVIGDYKSRGYDTKVH